MFEEQKKKINIGVADIKNNVINFIFHMEVLFYCFVVIIHDSILCMRFCSSGSIQEDKSSKL